MSTESTYLCGEYQVNVCGDGKNYTVVAHRQEDASKEVFHGITKNLNLVDVFIAHAMTACEEAS